MEADVRTGARAVRVGLPHAWLPALGIAAWGAAAYLLWSSSEVPGGLDLSGLDVHRSFTSHELHASAAFARVARLDFLLGEALVVVAAVLYARYGGRLARKSQADRVSTGLVLGLLGLAVQWAAGLPAELLGVWWARRHGLLHEGYAAAVFQNWLGLGGALLALVGLFVVMVTDRRIGERWWLVAAPLFAGLGALLALATPSLLPALHPLRDPKLAATAARLERAEGVGKVPVRVQSVHRLTALPNAEAVGLGPTRRVILTDTLLSGRFTDRQVRVVLAHELGHQQRGHIWKSLVWSFLLLLPAAWVVARVTRRCGGMCRPEAVPLALLVVVVLQLVALPVHSAISRHLEAEADWVALDTTRDPQAAATLFHRLAAVSLQQPDPPTWDYLLLEDHPTAAQRIAMARAWAAPRNP